MTKVTILNLSGSCRIPVKHGYWYGGQLHFWTTEQFQLFKEKGLI